MEKISNLESIDIKKVHVGYINENIDLWDELFDNSSVQYFFGNYNWMRSFWDACDSTHDSIIILAIEQNTNRWLGLLPITKYKTGLKDLFTTIVSQTADEYLDYFLPIVRKQFEEIVIPLLIQHFISADIKSHLLRIVNVPDENFIFPIIINTIEKYKIKYHLEPSGCPQLIFHGKSAGSLFNSFKKNRNFF